MSSLLPVLENLLEKGVRIPHPSSVYVAEDVDADRIHESAVLYPGTRLEGSTLSIGPESEIGAECPATVRNCQLGAGVSLKGGFFEGSVFLDQSSVGSSAHVRAGCLLEEEACAAHSVGLKQTILFPFVTLGSLINFCDILMAGGTSRKNHSEVGSSFIHFNFTPHSDKATASLIGDVARGVLLNQPPIFLGGQGGIVGPVEMNYGVVQAAGSICRKDLSEENYLFQSAVSQERWAPYQTGVIRDPESKWRKNITYIASLRALEAWYAGFRRPVMLQDAFTQFCVSGAEDLLKAAGAERLKQLTKWVGFLPEDPWAGRLEMVKKGCGESVDSSGLQQLVKQIDRKESYTETIRGLASDQQQEIQQFFEQEIQRLHTLAEAD